MKKVFGLGLFLGLSLGANALLFAQDNTQNNSSDKMNRRGAAGKMRGERRGIGEFKNLNLTDQQKEQIKKIRESARANQAGADETRQLMTARRRGTLTADQQNRLNALREQRRAESEKINQQIQAVLTAEQRNQLAQTKQNRAGNKGMKTGKDRKVGKERGGLGSLNLTDSQKQQIKDLRKNGSVNDAARQELRQLAQAKRSGTLTAEQQTRLQTLRDQSKTNGEKRKDQIAAILTPEQRQQLEQNKAQRKERRRQKMQNAPNK